MARRISHPYRFSLVAVIACGLVAAGLIGRNIPRAAGAALAPAPANPAVTNAATLAAVDQEYSAHIKPFFVQNCYACHGNGKHKGGVALDHYANLAAIQADHRTWGTIADVLSTKTMPPEDEPQPKKEDVNATVGWIAQALSLCDCTGPRDPGRVAIHRLNRTEYNNTIRDLLGVDFQPAKEFPADDTGYGFDNIADVLSMSPLLAEKYLSAAEQVLDKAIVTDATFAPKTQKYDASKLEATNGNNGGDLQVNGEVFGTHEFPADGDYEFRLKAGQDKFGEENAKMVLKLDDKELQTFSVSAPRRAPRAYKFRAVGIKAGKHKYAAEYTNNKVDRNNPDRKKRGDRNLYVDTIEIEGPFNAAPPPLPASHKRIFFVTPGPSLSEPAAARQIVQQFAARAFRRPVSVEEVESLLKVYRGAKADGEDFVDAVKVTLEATLVSPDFLYRIEVDPPTAGMTAEQLRNAPAHNITDYELASRLSYFLWSSMPDDELFRLAQAKTLHTPAVLDMQVRRMLADPKSAALVNNFVGQWLETRALDDYHPDPDKFPEFDDDLRKAMKQEVALFFENMVREDRSVLELLDANYTFLNERLAKHYGIPGITGEQFRRVNLADCGEAGTHRGGVLEMAGVLTITAMPTRTSPVRRGKFLLEQMLGTPPPPPPADVPPLDRGNEPLTGPVRVRLERHRADPNCAVCHIRMDPLGFALENFNALGAWRSEDNGFKIDPSGKLPDGTILNGPADVKKALLARKNDFVKTMAEKMLTYALGRGTEYYDTCTLRDVAGEVEKNNYHFSAMIGALVKSDAFLKRRPFAELKLEKAKAKQASKGAPETK
ncbi:MAG TPA: DUF1592 domain-containing protein [Tepidisphaeraceae bacterium]|jgi:mono/diheme cytochrome c family protein|nr:DUF1592 domain-containing protein [Tepidisphaeraceae bacterium]